MSNVVKKTTVKTVAPKPQRAKKTPRVVKTVVTTDHGPGRSQARRMRKAGFVDNNGHRYVVGKNNIADPRNIARSLGRTATGCAWALRALHPCGEDIVGTLAGIPDRTTTPVACPEGRGFWNIKMPNLGDRLSSTGMSIPSQWTTAANWNILITSIPDIRGLYVIQASAIDQFYQGQLLNLALKPNEWFYAVPTPTPADIAADKTIVSAAIMYVRVPVFPSDDAVAVNNLKLLADSVRLAYLGTTTHLNASSLNNQGRIVAGQFSCEATPSDLTGLEEDVVNIHFTSDQAALTQKDPKAYNGQAKDGCYIPTRIGDPVLLMRPVPAKEPAIQLNPPSNATIADNSFEGFVDSSWLITQTYYLGIDKAATIDLKCRLGIECAVSSNSAWGPFSRGSPLLDTVALDTVASLGQSMPHAFPAAFNDLGKILQTIAGGLAGLGIPIVSDIAKFAQPFAGSIGSAISNLFSG